jgi:hypothetical protein
MGMIIYNVLEMTLYHKDGKCYFIPFGMQHALKGK